MKVVKGLHRKLDKMLIDAVRESLGLAPLYGRDTPKGVQYYVAASWPHVSTNFQRGHDTGRSRLP